MSIFASPRFLRNVLLADSASCLAPGALQLAFTQFPARDLSLPARSPTGRGVVLPA